MEKGYSFGIFLFYWQYIAISSAAVWHWVQWSTVLHFWTEKKDILLIGSFHRSHNCPKENNDNLKCFQIIPYSTRINEAPTMQTWSCHNLPFSWLHIQNNGAIRGMTIPAQHELKQEPTFHCPKSFIHLLKSIWKLLFLLLFNTNKICFILINISIDIYIWTAVYILFMYLCILLNYLYFSNTFQYICFGNYKPDEQ